jgi:dUTP pyrophosphatase
MINFIRTFDHDLPLPNRATPRSAGLDLHTAEDVTILPGERHLVSTGWSWDTSGYSDVYGRVAPRSGLAVKLGIDVLAGVIDADYQGEIKVPLINHGQWKVHLAKGDRIAQLILEAYITPTIGETAAYSVVTDRGEGGFGGSGA